MAEPDNDTVTLAVVVARLDDIKDDIKDARKDIADFKKEAVSRGEWVQRNNHVDERFRNVDDKFAGQRKETDDKFDSKGKEIASLQAEMSSKRAPWWSVAAILLAAASFVWPIIDRIP